MLGRHLVNVLGTTVNLDGRDDRERSRARIILYIKNCGQTYGPNLLKNNVCLDFYFTVNTYILIQLSTDSNIDMTKCCAEKITYLYHKKV